MAVFQSPAVCHGLASWRRVRVVTDFSGIRAKVFKMHGLSFLTYLQSHRMPIIGTCMLCVYVYACCNFNIKVYYMVRRVHKGAMCYIIE